MRDEVKELRFLEKGAALNVRVRALPEDGAANRAVIATLAKALKLPKSDFSVLSGETSRSKTLLLQTKKAPLEDVQQRLSNLVKGIS